MAKGLAQARASVAIVDVNDDGAALTAVAIEEQGGRAAPMHCDMTDRRAVDALAEQVIGELRRVDVLVNSAGVAFRAPAETFPEEEFERRCSLLCLGQIWVRAEMLGRLDPTKA